MFQLSENERIIRKNAKALDTFVTSVIESKRRKDDGTLGPDLVSRFLDETEGEPLSVNEVGFVRSF